MACELDLIMQKEGQCQAFEESWESYCKAIIAYAQASQGKSKDLRHALRDCDGESTYCSYTLVKNLSHVY